MKTGGEADRISILHLQTFQPSFLRFVDDAPPPNNIKTMPSQYDTIGSQYDMIKRTTFNRIEQHNFRKHVSPFLQNSNTRVLDLACGTGFYSHLLLSWGASSVVGVDLSPVMVEAATNRLSETLYADQAVFRCGNGFGRDPVKNLSGQEGEDFDIVTGVWFLNYAKDKEEMIEGFRTIASNLKPSGALIAVCPNPVEDLDTLAASVNACPHSPSGVLYKYPKKLENGEGYVMTVKVLPPLLERREVEPLQFSGFHLRRSLWEEAARAAGMTGRLEWNVCEIPEEIGEDTEEWKSLRRNPQLAVLIVYKK
ncbi:hypothetical protein NLG97_g7766 [Lecanicillium saksenae]|uniref:Uncharacterized protein n=1 Tax=Lecanicillium saksenae TaxID=468837 RepID=A0ACC1QNF2_9HYPO|nr:hypothetical protein NLG97_g7766 [Lecanicillium saksenae]